MRKALITFVLTYFLIFSTSVFAASGISKSGEQHVINSNIHRNITVPSPKHMELLDNISPSGGSTEQDNFFSESLLIFNQFMIYLGF